MKKLFFLLLCFSFPVQAIECPSDEPIEYEGRCLSCHFWGYDVKKSECAKCPSREFINGKCVMRCEEKEFRGFGNYKNGEPDEFCTSCDSNSYNVLTTEQECNKCSNRAYIDGFCISKDKPMKGQDCNAFFPESVSKKICDLCPNREYINDICYIKDEILIKKSKEKCNCKSDEFTVYTIPRLSPSFSCQCLKCSEKVNSTFRSQGFLYKTDKQECDRCSNRKYEGGRCILNKCSEGEFRDRKGSCLPCGLEWADESTKEECLKCSNREYVNGKCILKTCPKKSPIKRDGSCVSCDSEANEVECALCDEFKYVNGTCLEGGKFIVLSGREELPS